MIHTTTYTVVCEHYPRCQQSAKIEQDGPDIDYDLLEASLKNLYEWFCVDGEHYCPLCTGNVKAEIAEAEEDERATIAADDRERAIIF